MPSGSYIQSGIQCPYYSSDDGSGSITCEGIIPDTSTKSVFRRKADYTVQITQFCGGKYWNCEICQALDRKYEEE